MVIYYMKKLFQSGAKLKTYLNKSRTIHDPATIWTCQILVCLYLTSSSAAKPAALSHSKLSKQVKATRHQGQVEEG